MVIEPTSAATCPRPPLLYRSLSRLAWPALALMSVQQARKSGDPTLLRQRLGRALPYRAADIWCHCASVGEVNTAAPLVDALLERGYRLHVTTVTATGAATARRHWGDTLAVSYLPLDSHRATSGFFDALRPRVGLITETEIWPHLYANAARAEVELVVINGRLSRRSLDAPDWWRAIVTDAVGRLHSVLARSQRDADGWRDLGVAAERIAVLGNLKYAALGDQPSAHQRLLEQPYWLAASTHADEERDIASAWAKAPTRTGHKLVIVPRHIDRAGYIRRQLDEAGLRVAQRSAGDPVAEHTDVVLADTFGELQSWYAAAEAVFVGGSLVDIGGHNVLEPALHGRWIATGPSVHNFCEEIDYLRQQRAITCVQSARELVEQVCSALRGTDLAAEQGQRAREAIEAIQGVLPRYLAAIESVYASTNHDQAPASYNSSERRER